MQFRQPLPLTPLPTTPLQVGAAPEEVVEMVAVLVTRVDDLSAAWQRLLITWGGLEGA